MTKSLLKSILTAFFLFTQLLTFAQSAEWNEIPSSRALANGEAMINARVAKYYELDFPSLHTRLINGSSNEPLTIDLPMPDGKTISFHLKSNTTMQPGLQVKLPYIRSFDAISTDGQMIQAKIDVSPAGLHAAVALNGGTVFIDPLHLNQNNIYIVYRRSDFTTDKTFDCLFEGSSKTTTGPKSGSSYGACELKIYRLAMAATGEYTQFHGGTVELGMAAIVTTVNRVNQVYERDLGVTLSLVENNDEIVYTSPSGDPYSNNNPFAMLNQNQSNINAVIGSANYDVGHVVSTGGGGVAGLGVTCQNGQKARGVTGTSTPIGDPFDIDYVAHEMGHQFGANHTFNNSCQGNRNNYTAVEPGSGSTIMGYAGICPPNVQVHSDAYFHGISLREIGINVSDNTCQVIVSTGNTAPVIDSVMTDLYLPISTPFALTGYSYDEDPADDPTYTWEQMDVEISQQPPMAASTGGPNFRTFDPSDSPTRYFPRLSTLASSGTSIWEVLPSVSRDMNFRFTVRDNALGGGCTQYEDATLHFVALAGPFLVTYPNATDIEWNSFDTETVTWDVAGTDATPINAQWVDIFLSIDGGQSYPITLAEAVANTGEASVEVPNVFSTQARVMVMSSSGTFFDVSDNNFSINGIANGFVVMSENPDSSICIGDDLVLDLHIEAIGDFSDPVSISVVNPPLDYDITLGVTELLPGESTTLTISNTGGVLPGMADFTVLGQADDMEHSRLFNIGFNEANLLTPMDFNPSNGAEDVSTNPLLSWTPSASPDAVFRLQLSQDEAFTEFIINIDNAASSFQVLGLDPETTYYWRVAAANPCDTTAFSAIHSFTTLSCYSFVADDLPVPIAPVVTTVTSIINLPFGGIVSDVKVLGVSGTHTRISDLAFYLVSPAGTEVELLANVCGNDKDFNISFDDAAVFTSPDCPPTSGQVVKPNQPLSTFTGEDMQGLWKLKLMDSQIGGGGQLTDWTLEICTADGETFLLVPEGNIITSCQGGEHVLDIGILEVFGFDEPVALSTSGLPNGVVASFDPETATIEEPSVMTLTIGASASPGQFEFMLVGTVDSEVVEQPMTLLVNESTPEPVTLISPAQGESEVPVSETFHWQESASPIAIYELEIAHFSDFTDVFDVVSDIDTNAYTYSGLPPLQSLFWRVKTNNTCGISFSDPAMFTTRPCTLQVPEDLPISISTAAPVTYTSTLDVVLSGQLASIRVSALRGTHARVSDLTAWLISPMGTEVMLFEGICPGEADFFLNFEDGASETIDCPPTLGQTVAPAEPLSAFANEDPFGTWTLKVKDSEIGIGGEILEWNMELCYDEEVFATDNAEMFALNIFPNPTEGYFRIALGPESAVDRIEIRDVAGRLLEVYAMNGRVELDVNLSRYAAGVYFVRAIGDAGAASYKLIKSR